MINLKGYEKPIIMAAIISILLLISTIVVIILFKILSSSGFISGSWEDYKIELGGAIVGLVVIFERALAHFDRHVLPKKPVLRGNTLDESGHYIEGANIAIDGMATGKQKTRENGYFAFEVGTEQTEWVLRAHKGALHGEKRVTAKDINHKIDLILKKKL